MVFDANFLGKSSPRLLILVVLGHQLFADMLEQAQAADRLGYLGVTIQEHHPIKILLTPLQLQMAVKVASITERVEVGTLVAGKLIPDIGVFAGEFSQAYILTDGRLVLGVGRGDLIDPH